MKAYSHNGERYGYYGYDASGERTYKYDLFYTGAGNSEEGGLRISFQLNKMTLYPNGYLNMNHNGEYTKHYYAGEQRIASRLGGNSVSISTNTSDRLGFRIMQVDQQTRADLNNLEFSYALEKPKTLAYDFSQSSKQNVRISTQEFMSDSIQRKPHLISLQFELTSRCNECCIHCYIPNDKKNHGFDMPKQKVFSILDEYAAQGGISVTMSEGRSLYAQRHNRDTSILPQERPEDFCSD